MKGEWKLLTIHEHPPLAQGNDMICFHTNYRGVLRTNGDPCRKKRGVPPWKKRTNVEPQRPRRGLFNSRGLSAAARSDTHGRKRFPIRP